MAAAGPSSTAPVDPVVCVRDACYHGKMLALKRLTAEGALADAFAAEAAGDEGSTTRSLLYLAAMRGHVPVVSFLLAQGAQPDVYGMEASAAFVSPLHVAAQNGYAGVVAKLLAAGAEPDARGGRSPGCSPLYAASQNGHVDVITALLDFGADPMCPWSPGSALWAAVQHKHLAAVLRLADSPRVDLSAGCGGTSPLYLACQMGWVECVKVLLMRGADAGVASRESGATPLLVAVQQGHVAVAQELLSDSRRRCDPNAVEPSRGMAALHFACSRGTPAMLRLLLSKGADPALCDSAGSMPLAHAAASGNVEAVRAMVAARAPLGGGPNAWVSPTEIARRQRHASVCRVLDAAVACSRG